MLEKLKGQSRIGNSKKWQHWVHKTKIYKTQNTRQYVFDTTIHKTQDTRQRHAILII